MLEHIRVLDLTDGDAQLAGFILASLGADVVLVERPQGSATRWRAPFVDDVPDPEQSLTFWAWNRGKRATVLDRSTPDGAAAFSRLVATADVIIADGDNLAGLDSLRRAHPALVTAVITPYGSSGPRASWPATDLTICAAGCQMALSGDADRAPVRVPVPQAILHAASDVACGVLAALAERVVSGRGQHVEAAAIESIMQATQSNVLNTALGGTMTQRTSGGTHIGGLDVQLRWPCLDGYVSVTFLFGASVGPFTKRLLQWLWEEGYCDEATRDKDWLEYANLLYDGREPVSEFERVKSIIGEFCATRTKDELLLGACERKLLIAPIASPGDLLENPQFAYRNFFDELVDPSGTRIARAPGPWVRSNRLEMPRPRTAPRLGEHLSDDLADERSALPTPVSSGERRAPLEGLKVLDLSWAMAGPAATRLMADLGATVVKLETSVHVDLARTVAPFVADKPGNDSSGLYFNLNVGKRSVSVNLLTDEGRAVLDDLVRWCDVVIESYSPAARNKLGVDYERLHALRPGLVMLSSCLFGQTGPLSNYAGFGTAGAALAGFFDITGWADRPPSGPFGAYTDFPAPRFAFCAILAALEHRRLTGEGQYLDLSQAEAGTHFLAPAFLRASLASEPAERRGNDDSEMSPHGVYPSAGDDTWIAIACRDERDWDALANIVGRADLARLDVAGRRARRVEIDGAISAWTVERGPEDAAVDLVTAGVPAYAVQNSAACIADEQLQHLGHWLELPHPEHGTITVEAPRVRLSDTPAEVRWGPPVIGQDTFEVLSDWLGYSDDRIGQLFVAGALE